MVTQGIAFRQGIWSQWLMTCSDPEAPDSGVRLSGVTGSGAIGRLGPEMWWPTSWGGPGAVGEEHGCGVAVARGLWPWSGEAEEGAQ